MDLKLNQLFRHLVLVSLLLEVQSRPVLRAPRSFSCEDDVESTKKLSEVLTTQAKELLENYTQTVGSYASSTDEDVPDSSVSGENFSMKLLDIYAKDQLFSLHLAKVKVYLGTVLEKPQTLENLVTQVEGSISNLLTRVKQIIEELYKDTSVPPTPEPLNITHDDFERKEYIWHVVDRVKSWGAQVAQVLEEGKKECENKSAGNGK